jgi:hypothetical protein
VHANSRPPLLSIVCEEGHLLQGYVQESVETQAISQHFSHRRHINKKRKTRVRKVTNVHYHGERATFLHFQCLQWILREQLRIMVEELGYPEELERVGKELWGMLVASRGVPAAPLDHFNGDEPPTSFTGPRDGRRKRRKKAGQEDSSDLGSESDEEERGSRNGDSQDSQDEEEEVAEEAKKDEMDEDEDEKEPVPTNPYVVPLKRISKERPSKAGPKQHPPPETLLIILYLGCIALRLPVFLNDILE